MRRWIVYLLAFALAAAFGIFPFSGTDVGKLLPVEAVRVSKLEKGVLLETDTDCYGQGSDLASALENLKATATGTVFLETADYLILTPGSQDLLSELYAYLRPNCDICIQMGTATVEDIAAFLSSHEPKLTLQEYQGGIRKVPLLIVREEQMELVQ